MRFRINLPLISKIPVWPCGLVLLAMAMTIATTAVSGQEPSVVPGSADASDAKRVERKLRAEIKRLTFAQKRREATLRSDFEKQIRDLDERLSVLAVSTAPPMQEPPIQAVSETQVSADSNVGSGGMQIGLLAGMIGIGAVGMLLFWKTRSETRKSAEKTEERIAGISESLVKADESLVRLLSEAAEGKAAKVSTDSVPNHAFYLRVADEIVRIRNYSEVMPSETKGLRHLQASLKRLQADLEAQGYEIIEMVGMRYDLGLEVKAEFRHDPTMEAGAEVITKVKRPQVNYRDKLIQMAEIEVTHNV